MADRTGRRLPFEPREGPATMEDRAGKSHETPVFAVSVALCGKGGVGKTALSTLMVQGLRRTGKRILAVDADPAMGLTLALGAGRPKTIGQIREHVIRVARKRDSQETERVADMVDYYLLESLVEKDGFSLLAMGRTEVLGCYCPVNSLLREAVEALSASFDLMVLDAEAGLEQINRKVLRRVDNLVVVSDPSARGFHTAGAMRELVQSQEELRPGRIGLVVNRCPPGSEGDWERSAREQGLELLGTIPEDTMLGEMDRSGNTLLDLPADSEAMRGVRAVLARLGLP
jgi:CO dehydrogenase maturation factor